MSAKLKSLLLKKQVFNNILRKFRTIKNNPKKKPKLQRFIGHLPAFTPPSP
jgi:hypothetical protein